MKSCGRSLGAISMGEGILGNRKKGGEGNWKETYQGKEGDFRRRGAIGDRHCYDGGNVERRGPRLKIHGLCMRETPENDGGPVRPVRMAAVSVIGMAPINTYGHCRQSTNDSPVSGDDGHYEKILGQNDRV